MVEALPATGGGRHSRTLWVLSTVGRRRVVRLYRRVPDHLVLHDDRRLGAQGRRAPRSRRPGWTAPPRTRRAGTRPTVLGVARRRRAFAPRRLRLRASARDRGTRSRPPPAGRAPRLRPRAP